MISIVVVSKDEPELDRTLAGVTAQAATLPDDAEVVVVDASRRRLEDVRRRHPDVRWLDFEPPAGVRVSIPHQRNAGVGLARGEVVVFTDAGCVPRPGWLTALVDPVVRGDESVACGIAPSPGEARSLYDARIAELPDGYLSEAPTINLAFRRGAFDSVGGFDERFEYGSDIDFTWRLVDAGHRIKAVPEAVVEHDWGGARRQLRRGFHYGKARARLYRKHRRRFRRAWREDPMVLAYPLFLLGLPVALVFPGYLALLAIPAWRNRANGAIRVLADHLVFGAGVLRGAMAR